MVNNMLVCLHCGNVFSPKSRCNLNQKYCSLNCCKYVNQKRWYKKASEGRYHIKYYLEHKSQIRLNQKRYENQESAKRLKRKAEAKPERKLKKKIYTKSYQQRLDVREKRKKWARDFKKTPKGRLKAKIDNQLRRAKILNSPISKLSRKEWRAKWNEIRDATRGKCLLCNRIVGIENMSMDHVVPLSKGGAHEISNIIAICKRCNSKKGNRDSWIDYTS